MIKTTLGNKSPWCHSTFATTRRLLYQEATRCLKSWNRTTGFLEGRPTGRVSRCLILSYKTSFARRRIAYKRPFSGEYVVHSGKSYKATNNSVIFNIINHPVKVTVVEALKGKSGWLGLQSLIIESFDREEYLLLSGVEFRWHDTIFLTRKHTG